MKIKIYLIRESTLEKDVFLEGNFQLTVNKDGIPLSVRTEDKKLLLANQDFDILIEE